MRILNDTERFSWHVLFSTPIRHGPIGGLKTCRQSMFFYNSSYQQSNFLQLAVMINKTVSSVGKIKFPTIHDLAKCNYFDTSRRCYMFILLRNKAEVKSFGCLSFGCDLSAKMKASLNAAICENRRKQMFDFFSACHSTAIVIDE